MGPYGFAALGLMLAAGILLHYAAHRVRLRRWRRAYLGGDRMAIAPSWPHWRVWYWWMKFHRWRLGVQEYGRREFAMACRASIMGWVVEHETRPGVLARLPWAVRNSKLRFLLFWYHKGAADDVMAAYGRQHAAREAEKERLEREAAARKEREEAEETRRRGEERKRRSREENERRRRERERRERGERERQEQRGHAGPHDDPGEPWGLKGETAYRRACEIMGLDGAFGKAELIRRYRGLQAALHPDKGGSGYFAKQLNWARDVIMRRHGW